MSSELFVLCLLLSSLVVSTEAGKHKDKAVGGTTHFLKRKTV